MSAEPGKDFQSLYPFLYSGTSDLEAVLSEVRDSTVQKVDEIIALREEIARLDGARLAECAWVLARSFTDGRKLFAFGNGGSSTDAQSVASLFLHPTWGEPLPALCLTNDIAVVTALSNDVGFDVVFARQLAALGEANDIAVGLSTSGNSENLIQAFEAASRRGLITVGLAGYDGGKMAEIEEIDYLFVAPSSSVHRIQEAQTTTYHILWELTQAAMSSVAAAH
ncbi:MAG: D-sedoheptulose-7-phosphate isomerase [Egibacteraceae bacterium]